MKKATSEQAAPTLPSKSTVLRGLQIFIIFSTAGILAGFWWKRPTEINTFLFDTNWILFIWIMPLVFLTYLIGGLRFHIFFSGKVLPRISLWNCIRSDWANLFFGTVTPFKTGGGPAQVYILWRHGAKISNVVLVSLINFSATLIFFTLAGSIAVLTLPTHLMDDNLTVIIRTAFIFMIISLAIIILGMLFPRPGLSIVKKFFNVIPLKNKKFLNIRQRILTFIENGVANFERAFREVLKGQKKWLVLTVLLTTSLYLTKYFIGFIIAKTLENGIPLDTFINLQIIQLILLYFSPTPGASGVAEISSVWLIGYLISEGNIMFFTLLWRFFTTILGAIIGGFVMFFDVRQWLAKSPQPEL